ncbi:MAG: biopolymer transporter ExbD [Bacteroidota bacterium]|nr:biopolymer transporter ExbD [Bacteroidota bacterium]
MTKIILQNDVIVELFLFRVSTGKLLMTEILITGGNRRRAGVRRIKRPGIRIDMTPMADLGFLLITFFVMTTELNRPSVVNLAMPKDGSPMPLGNSNALTILLDQDGKAYYYQGNWKEALARNEIVKTNLSVTNGFGKVIREKQQWLDGHNKKEGRNGLMLIIKANRETSYQNVIKSLDEAMINLVAKYTVLSAGPEESEWMKAQNR